MSEGRTPRVVWARGRGWHVRGYGAPKDETEAPPLTGFRILPFMPIDPRTIPMREWLYGRHYQRGKVGATVAPGGFGKTSLCMVEGVAMATARNLLGEQPTARLRVWYHNGDDDIEEIDRRLVAICMHYGIPQEELQHWFFRTSSVEVPLKVAHGYNDIKIDRQLVTRLRDEITDKQIDVAIIDPLVTIHGVSEQDNNKMDSVIRLFASIADDHECSIDLVHHTRKLAPGAADYDGDDMRGASSIRDAVRVVRVLNLMTTKDAENFAIEENERKKFFRVDRVKANNAPRTEAVWRQFTSYVLPNGPEDGEGDDVGVVTAWNCPGKGEPTEAMVAAHAKAKEVFRALLIRFTIEERPVNDVKHRYYAPKLFAQEEEAKTARVGVVALEGAMRELMREGTIKIQVEKGRSGREDRVLIIA